MAANLVTGGLLSSFPQGRLTDGLLFVIPVIVYADKPCITMQMGIIPIGLTTIDATPDATTALLVAPLAATALDDAPIADTRLGTVPIAITTYTECDH